MEVYFVDKAETNFVNSFTEQKWVICLINMTKTSQPASDFVDINFIGYGNKRDSRLVSLSAFCQTWAPPNLQIQSFFP
jgi:hypothetical protein